MEREPGEVYILAIVPFLVAGTILVVISYVVPYATWLVRYGVHLLRHGTPLQRGLARFWLAASAGWLVHSIWWIAAHCSYNGYGSCTYTTGAFAVVRGNARNGPKMLNESAQFDALDLWGYVLTTPMMLLLATVATYWVIRGFRPRVG